MNAQLIPHINHQWQPTARSVHGRHVQASRLHHALIRAIHRRGMDVGADDGAVLDAMDSANAELRARGWHPDQFPFGSPVDDFMDGTNVDYEQADT